MISNKRSHYNYYFLIISYVIKINLYGILSLGTNLNLEY